MREGPGLIESQGREQRVPLRSQGQGLYEEQNSLFLFDVSMVDCEKREIGQSHVLEATNGAVSPKIS